MAKTIGRIGREGKINFHDASLFVWEEGISAARDAGGFEGARKWEQKFKRDVFARIIQTLNRLGWTCTIPEEMIKQYSVDFARTRRFCQKGDLKADLSISGRRIEFKMFQNVNAPDRSDHGGRYQRDQERHMPYVMRLEMERTRRRIRDYLCGVFTGYSFDDVARSNQSKCGIGGVTAQEWLQLRYRESWHFKGDATPDYKIYSYNNRNQEGVEVQHKQPVWFFDSKGRVNSGIAYYNINNMWWVITGRYAIRNLCVSDLFTSKPVNMRLKRNASLRRKRLEAELQKAIAAMQFERAILLRDILFKKTDKVFNVWNREHNLYHRSGFEGYTSDQSKAGKFTEDEVKGWSDATNIVMEAA